MTKLKESLSNTGFTAFSKGPWISIENGHELSIWNKNMGITSNQVPRVI